MQDNYYSRIPYRMGAIIWLVLAVPSTDKSRQFWPIYCEENTSLRYPCSSGPPPPSFSTAPPFYFNSLYSPVQAFAASVVSFWLFVREWQWKATAMKPGKHWSGALVFKIGVGNPLLHIRHWYSNAPQDKNNGGIESTWKISKTWAGSPVSDFELHSSENSFNQ